MAAMMESPRGAMGAQSQMTMQEVAFAAQQPEAAAAMFLRSRTLPKLPSMYTPPLESDSIASELAAAYLAAAGSNSIDRWNSSSVWSSSSAPQPSATPSPILASSSSASNLCWDELPSPAAASQHHQQQQRHPSGCPPLQLSGAPPPRPMMFARHMSLPRGTQGPCLNTVNVSSCPPSADPPSQLPSPGLKPAGTGVFLPHPLPSPTGRNRSPPGRRGGSRNNNNNNNHHHHNNSNKGNSNNNNNNNGCINNSGVRSSYGPPPPPMMMPPHPHSHSHSHSHSHAHPVLLTNPHGQALNMPQHPHPHSQMSLPSPVATAAVAADCFKRIPSFHVQVAAPTPIGVEFEMGTLSPTSSWSSDSQSSWPVEVSSSPPSSIYPSRQSSFNDAPPSLVVDCPAACLPEAPFY